MVSEPTCRASWVRHVESDSPPSGNRPRVTISGTRYYSPTSTARSFQGYFAAKILVSWFAAKIWPAFRDLWREFGMADKYVVEPRSMLLLAPGSGAFRAVFQSGLAPACRRTGKSGRDAP